ncbi:MAG: glycosyltransferase family 2 protein [Planctomycetota bacterium]
MDPAADNAQPPQHLIVVLPALNEEATVGEVIDRIPRQIPGIDRVSVLVVDDGSTDATAAVAERAGAMVLRHRCNRGVGVSFRTGLDAALAAGADIIVNMDADGQFDPADIPTLIAPILQGRADMTTCTRFAREDLMPEMPRVKKWGNRMMCRLVNRICWRTAFTDVSCGFRAYSRETALRLTLFGDFTYTQESFIDLLSKGVHIVEVPLRVRGVRAHGSSRVASNLWRYAVRSGSIILRAARDVRPLRFFGLIGLVLLVLGLLCGGIVFGWLLYSGRTSPIQSLLTGSAVFLILGFLVLILALIADMLSRQRRLIEELLLSQRMQDQDLHRDRPSAAGAREQRQPIGRGGGRT